MRHPSVDRGAARRPVRPGRVFIGASGWHYAHWTGPFYPEGMAPGNFLAFYAKRFQSVEVNSTFYGLPAAETLAAWRDATPRGFIFACKASRYITHMKKLTDPGESTRRFFRVVDALEDKLGPILFQLPPRWRVNVGRLQEFLQAMPSRYRFAFEFRDETWFTPDVWQTLARHNAAFCAYDLDRRRSPVRLTADFAYFRLHGPAGPYCGQYDDRTLSAWARRIGRWSRSGIDVYGYFDNDQAGYAVADARRLLDILARRSEEGAGYPGRTRSQQQYDSDARGNRSDPGRHQSR